MANFHRYYINVYIYKIIHSTQYFGKFLPKN